VSDLHSNLHRNGHAWKAWLRKRKRGWQGG